VNARDRVVLDPTKLLTDGREPRGPILSSGTARRKRSGPRRALSSGVHAIAEVLLAEELGTEAHDFDALFRDAGSGVFRTLYAYTGGRRDVAEEAMAEAFARALARSDTIRDPVAWIYRTAFRIANDELRAERRRGSAPVDVEASPPELSGLMEALRTLSPSQRAAIVMRHVLDLDVAEIAKRMGTAAPTVRVHLHRGRKRLRELLGAEEVDDA
jgi:RNA polymerase sigma-70 factor, ECF subfamily